MAFDLDDDELRATRKLNGVEWKEDKQIQVGDYVRTDKGNIVKADEKWFRDKLIEGNSVFGKALKHSQNLIDLVECGDYVNGERVIDKLQTPCKLGEDGKKFVFTQNMNIGEGYFEEEIKSIVTHEQFNSVMYKVKE